MRDRIANGCRTEACDRWILRLEDDFINLFRFETRRHTHAAAIRSEIPLITRNRAARTLRGIPDGEHVRRVLRIDGCIGDVHAVSERCLHDLFYGLEITAYKSVYRPSVGLARNREVSPKRSFTVWHIELPTHPQQ